MLHQLLSTEYLFWLVALIFYFSDNVKLVNKSQVLVTETIYGRYRPSFSFNTFEIKGQQVYLLNLLVPFTGYLKLNSQPKVNPSVSFKKTKFQLLFFQRAVFPFKFISLVSFLYLLSGPILTFYFGLGAALLFLLPVHLVVLFITFVLLLVKRTSLGLNYGSISLVFFDCLVVPSYLPNIVRKIYKKKDFLCDGYYFSLHMCSKNDIDEIRYNISRNIDLAIEYLDEDKTKEFLVYKNTLGIKNDK